MGRSKIIALIVAALYLAGFIYFLTTDVIGQDISREEKIDAAETTVAVIGWLVVCLALIFRGDEIGQWKDYFVGLRYIDSTSPGIAVVIIGWLLLLTPGIFFLVTLIKRIS
jgi:uncharacterized membrane protein